MRAPDPHHDRDWDECMTDTLFLMFLNYSIMSGVIRLYRAKEGN